MITINARSLRILIELNLLQSFGAVQSYAGQTGPSSTHFNSMLEDALGNSSVPHTQESLRYAGVNQVFIPENLPTSIPTPSRVPTASTIGASKYNGQYAEIIREAAKEYNLPDSLISSIIKHESNFNANSVSHAGAEGLMQLMPGTAKFLGVTNSFDPSQNIKGGARYLRQMLNQFDGNTEHALAAYNAGPGNVRKYGGVPPFKETQNYVNKVLNTFHS